MNISSKLRSLDPVQKRMLITGFMGFLFMCIANFTNLLAGLNVLAGCIQLVINCTVFGTWLQGWFQAPNWKGRLFRSVGVAVPVAMATLTIFNVLLPALTK